MKRFVSVLMIFILMMSFAAISTSALDSAQTEVSVNKGDEVIYTLKLTTPEKVVGCDFSVYYDSSALQVQAVADYTGNFDADEHQAVINPNIKDEVIGNWSVLSGVKFNNNNQVVSVKFKAIKKTDTHISYYVRYLYPESMEQFVEYKFTCSVDVNKKAVIENEAPELNVEIKQPHGLFVNSVTGDGKDANVNTSTHVPNTPGKTNGGEVNENDVNNSNNKDNSNNTGNSTNKKDNTDKSKDNDKDVKNPATEVVNDAETQAIVNNNANVDSEATLDSSPSQTDDGGIFGSVWLWIILGVIVIGGAAAVVLVVFIKKKSNA